jgi:hypothetical protein
MTLETTDLCSFLLQVGQQPISWPHNNNLQAVQVNPTAPSSALLLLYLTTQAGN